MAPKPEDVLTQAEVAELLDVNPHRLRDWIRGEQFCFPAPFKPARGKGTRPLFWRPDVERWYRRQKFTDSGYLIAENCDA